MHMNRRLPEPGECPLAFLCETVLDAIRDAKGAGLSDVDAWEAMERMTRLQDPMGRGRVSASEPAPFRGVDPIIKYVIERATPAERAAARLVMERVLASLPGDDES